MRTSTFEDLEADLFGEQLEVALMIKRKTGEELRAITLPSATVVMERVTEDQSVTDFYYRPIDRIVTRSLMQVRLTTSGFANLYYPEFFRGGARPIPDTPAAIDAARRGIEGGVQ